MRPLPVEIIHSRPFSTPGMAARRVSAALLLGMKANSSMTVVFTEGSPFVGLAPLKPEHGGVDVALAGGVAHHVLILALSVAMRTRYLGYEGHVRLGAILRALLPELERRVADAR